MRGLGHRDAILRVLACLFSALALQAAAFLGGAAASAARLRVQPLHPAVRLHGARSPFKVPDSAAHGVVPRAGAHATRFASRGAEPCTETCAGPLLYWGGQVMRRVKVYLIQWEPPEPAKNGQALTKFEKLEPSYSPQVETFLRGVAADGANHLLTNVFSVDDLYGEPEAGRSGEYSSEFGQALLDTHVYPAVEPLSCPTQTEAEHEEQPCISDSEKAPQLAEEVARFVTEKGLPTGLGAIYFVLTPHDVNSCAGGEGASAQCNTNAYCAYHSQLTVEPKTINEKVIIYANMPYDDVSGCNTPDQPHGSPADDEIDVLSHEFNEAVTDPTGQSWFDVGGNEVGDKCTYPFFSPLVDFYPAADAYGALIGGTRTAEYEEVVFEGQTFLVLKTPGNSYNQLIDGGTYLLQREWSNAAEGCVARAPVPVPSFGSYPSSPVSGSPVSFNGSGSSTAGHITGYEWSFGDGSGSTGGAQPQHTYGAPGTYTVTLTVHNDSGASATASHQVAVGSPPAPEVRTTSVTTTQTVNVPVEASISRYTPSALAKLLGLPRSGATLSGLGTIMLGHAECPPACGVQVRLIAAVRKGKHVRRLQIGFLKETIAKKGTGSIALRLTGKGKALLRKRHRLTVELVVSVEERSGADWTIERRLTLRR